MEKQNQGTHTRANKDVTSFSQTSSAKASLYPHVLTGPNGQPMHTGAVIAQCVRCGKPGCACQQGKLHGPYWYLFWRCGGRLHKAYLRPEQVEAARAACEEWRQFQSVLLSQRRETMQMFRQMRQLLRDMRKELE